MSRQEFFVFNSGSYIEPPRRRRKRRFPVLELPDDMLASCEHGDDGDDDHLTIPGIPLPESRDSDEDIVQQLVDRQRRKLESSKLFNSGRDEEFLELPQ